MWEPPLISCNYYVVFSLVFFVFKKGKSGLQESNKESFSGAKIQQTELLKSESQTV